MSANRTFQFYGIGFGNTPVTVTAQVNGTEIFSGEIPTIDRPIDPLPYLTPEINTTVLFSLTDSALFNTDFAGSVPMTVTVTGGTGALFGNIENNYYQRKIPSIGNVGTPYIATVDNFDEGYTGIPTNSEGTPDARSNVAIDGVQQVPPLPPSQGSWAWFVPTGSTLTYNWNIGLGQVGYAVGNSSNYIAPV